MTSPRSSLFLRAWALLGLGVLAGCAGLDPPEAPRAATVTLPAAAPRTTGVETAAARERKRLTSLFGGEVRAPATERYINAMLTRLAPASDAPGEPFHVTVLNSPVVNAFALPSGDLFVTRGLLALANDSSELAAVMAHEIAHVTARHAAHRAEREKDADVISKAAIAFQSREKGNEVRASHLISFASFSRLQELEADQVGVKTMARAGFDPFGASRFLNSLGRSAALRAASSGRSADADHPDIAATHPSTPERINRAIVAAREIGAPGLGRADRAEYLTAIDGLAFGDDPQEGFIRGRKFVHPKLGFGFIAPPNLTLENTAQAVLGVNADKSQALRLDSVRIPTSTPLETYLTSGWIEGIKPGSLEALTVNGLPGVTALARNGDWSFRLAAIRVDAEVYRIILAAHASAEVSDGPFREAIASFHRLAEGEDGEVKPLHIEITTAADGDTAEAIASRMASPDRSLEMFLALNGLERAGPLKAGERYKTIVE